MSYVYFIQDTRSGHVKVGCTRDVQERLRHLQTGSATPLRLLGYVVGTRITERLFHDLLGGHRIHGEWFTRDAAVALMRGIPVRRWVWLNSGAGKPGAERPGVTSARPRKGRWTNEQRREAAV